MGHTLPVPNLEMYQCLEKRKKIHYNRKLGVYYSMCVVVSFAVVLSNHIFSVVWRLHLTTPHFRDCSVNTIGGGVEGRKNGIRKQAP